MATYGVTYSGAKNPTSYGVGGRRTLSSLYSAPRAPAQVFNPISDTLNSLQVANQNRLNTIAPPYAAGVGAAGTPNPTYGSPPAPTAPAAASPAASAATTTPAGTTTDLSADPILTQIKAIGLRRAQDAAAGGLAGAKNDVINYGSVQVPQSLRDLFAASTPANDPILGDLPGNPVLGALNDANTATAAAANPFSTLANLGAAHDTNVHGIDQATNLANLYYSSTHANQLGQENQNYLGSQNTAAQNLAQLLSGENQGLLAALTGAHGQYEAELPNAYARALAAGAGPPVDPNAPPPPTAPPTDTGLAPGNPLGAALTLGANAAGRAAATSPINPILAALLRGAGMAGNTSRMS